MSNIDNCIKFYDERGNATVSEEGKSFTLKNISKVKIKCVKVDGCVYDSKTTKCDYLMIAEIKKKPKAYFIELKGCDIPHAVDQLYLTVNDLKSHFPNHILEARISNKGNTPDVKNRKTYINLAKVIYPTGGEILIRKSPLVETI